MKKSLSTSLLIPIAILIFTACENKQPVDQFLKNDMHRSEIISTVIDHHPYRTEMMNAMVENDSCRLLMGQKMMGRPEMMGMMMGDPQKMKGTMDHMFNMASKDSIMFNDMIQMMKERPEMWSKLMKLNLTINKNN